MASDMLQATGRSSRRLGSPPKADGSSLPSLKHLQSKALREVNKVDPSAETFFGESPKVPKEKHKLRDAWYKLHVLANDVLRLYSAVLEGSLDADSALEFSASLAQQAAKKSLSELQILALASQPNESVTITT